MNVFDFGFISLALVAAAYGFRLGFLRSLATILAYVAAAPLAIPATLWLAPLFDRPQHGASDHTFLFFVLFVAIGLAIEFLMRTAVSSLVGEDIGLPDRIAGAALGIVRVFLLGVLAVMALERLIPAARQPPWMTQSVFRPTLSAAGERGLRKLPPRAVAYIDRLKKEKGL